MREGFFGATLPNDPIIRRFLVMTTMGHSALAVIFGSFAMALAASAGYPQEALSIGALTVLVLQTVWIRYSHGFRLTHAICLGVCSLLIFTGILWPWNFMISSIMFTGGMMIYLHIFAVGPVGGWERRFREVRNKKPPR
jgi:hypothetical protein